MKRGVIVLVAATACQSTDPPPRPELRAPPRALDDPSADDRAHMVEHTIVARGITDPRVIDAMLVVPRHEFVPHEVRERAYEDRALPIGFDLTISQAFIVATMTEAAGIQPGDRVLEIGTGSGYQAAILSAVGAKVFTMEIVEPLAKRSELVLDLLGFDDVEVKVGDGFFGWGAAQPFDAILVTAAAPIVPPRLLAELAVGGRMVIPVGEDDQSLMVITRTADGRSEQELFPVRFGPMVGAIRRLVDAP